MLSRPHILMVTLSIIQAIKCLKFSRSAVRIYFVFVLRLTVDCGRFLQTEGLVITRVTIKGGASAFQVCLAVNVCLVITKLLLV